MRGRNDFGYVPGVGANEKPARTFPIVNFDQQQIMVRKISDELIFNTTFGLVTLTFGIFIEIDPRQPVPEFQLQPRSGALRQFANLFQTGPFRTISFTDTLVASASTILRWMIRKGIGSGNYGSRT
jgi:hypothetical protein